LIRFRGRDSHDAKSTRLQILGFAPIRFFVVTSAVDFDNQTSCQACEVGEVWSDWVLASELRA